jgi:hypothetical protein
VNKEENLLSLQVSQKFHSVLMKSKFFSLNVLWNKKNSSLFIDQRPPEAARIMSENNNPTELQQKLSLRAEEAGEHPKKNKQNNKKEEEL